VDIDNKGRFLPIVDDSDTCRYCPDCDKYLPFSEFYKDKRTKSGLTRRCRTHHSSVSYASRKKHETPNDRYEYSRKRTLAKYGLTPESYDNLVRSQNGVCAICNNPELGWYKLLHVDHDHRTNKIRGLLCSGCNTAIGKFYDNIELLENAIQYLQGEAQ